MIKPKNKKIRKIKHVLRDLALVIGPVILKALEENKAKKAAEKEFTEFQNVE